MPLTSGDPTRPNELDRTRRTCAALQFAHNSPTVPSPPRHISVRLPLAWWRKSNPLPAFAFHPHLIPLIDPLGPNEHPSHRPVLDTTSAPSTLVTVRQLHARLSLCQRRPRRRRRALQSAAPRPAPPSQLHQTPAAGVRRRMLRARRKDTLQRGRSAEAGRSGGQRGGEGGGGVDAGDRRGGEWAQVGMQGLDWKLTPIGYWNSQSGEALPVALKVLLVGEVVTDRRKLIDIPPHTQPGPPDHFHGEQQACPRVKRGLCRGDQSSGHQVGATGDAFPLLS